MTLRLCLLSIVCAATCGCGTTRNTLLDYRLPSFQTPTIDLAQYKSVQSRPGQNPDLALAVAISGGGHRAANFAIGALLGLESFSVADQPRNLLQEIDYLSTVSGGGFAAGVLSSSLLDHLKAGAPRSEYSLLKTLGANEGRLLHNLERDYQMTILEAMFHFRCITSHRDSGDLMERKFDRYLLGYAYRNPGRSLILRDVFKPAGSHDPVQLPYWVMNSTTYESGARFPFTPDILSQYHVNGYTHHLKNRSLNGDPYSLPLAVGMKASASFPIAFPATTFTCKHPQDRLNPYLHLLDGGLTDNTGVMTALELLKQDKAKRKLLLVVDAHQRSSFPYSRCEASPQGLQAADRVMRICLDTQHSHLEQESKRRILLAAASGAGDIRVVFLTFEQLKPALTEQIQDLNEAVARIRKEQREAVARRMQRELNTALRREEEALDAAQQTYSLYQDAHAVATSLNITRGQQQLLIKAGQQVVENNRECITRAIAGEAR